MKTQQNRSSSLLGALRDAGELSNRKLLGPDASVALRDLVQGTALAGRLESLAGRSILIATGGQLATALALIELDGVARRMTVCPADLPPEYLPPIIADAGAEAIVADPGASVFDSLGLPLFPCALPIAPRAESAASRHETEWVLLTSGTTGVPKLVMHSLKGLTGAIKPTPARERPIVWGTFYDIRRYGGLQIFLRAVTGTGSLVLSSAGEPVADHLHRLARCGVTHLSGTPSHWRRALMSPAAGTIAPEYVRLSGEIADQAILDNLRRAYPDAAIGHAYASTEAGVGFEVTDGLEGFPASLMGRDGDVQMKLEDGSLRIRSARTASLYVGSSGATLVDEEGFVDTGDMLELRGDRYYFIGRRGGIINVGGLKVHPEEVEAIINRHESVRMSLVKGRRNLVTGAIVVADIVLNDEALAAGSGVSDQEIKSAILRACRESLPPYKVPASIRFVPSLDVTAAGKLVRSNA
ncbi:MAG: AMP-binding protein [Hyphomicrobiales bacterium]